MHLFPFPVIVGVTGHCDIHPAAIETVSRNVDEILCELHREFGASLYVMTGLADGADQMVDRLAASRGIGRIAVLPVPLDTYVTKIKDRTTLQTCWDEADLQIELPALIFSGPPPSEQAFFNRHYEQLGAFLISRSHLLLALWEGPERAAAANRDRRPGGTADVLCMRFDVHRASAAFTGSALFSGCGSLLDVAHADPVLQIVCPKSDASEKQYRTAVGECYLLHDQFGHSKDRVRNATDLMASFSKKAKGAFEQITLLNGRIAEFPRKFNNLTKQHCEYLASPNVPEFRHCPVARLKHFQASADAAAAFYQRQIIGQLSGVPVTKFYDRFKSARKSVSPT